MGPVFKVQKKGRGFWVIELGEKEEVKFQLLLPSTNYELGMELEASTDHPLNPYNRPVKQILLLSHFTDKETEATEEQRLDRHPGVLAPRLVPLSSPGCCWKRETGLWPGGSWGSS